MLDTLEGFKDEGVNPYQYEDAGEHQHENVFHEEDSYNKMAYSENLKDYYK